MSNTKSITRHPGVYSYPTKKGLRYAAVVTVEGRQKWSRGHRTIAAAEDARNRLRQAMKTGRMGNAPARLTLAEYLETQWLPRLDVTPGTMRAYKLDVRRIVAALGTKHLAELRPLHIEDFKRRLRASGLAPTTQAHTFTRLGEALRQAVRWQLLGFNPADQVKPPRKGQYEPPALSSDEIGKLLEVADATSYGMLVYLAITTGMRESELFALQWQHIDFGAGQLLIPKAKTRKGLRAVALGPVTLERLRQHRMEQMRRFAELGAPSPQEVFVTLDGLPMRQSSFWPHWNAIRCEAGLPALHFHDLRHAQGTLLARAGVHPSVAQHRLGHASAAFTLDVYTRLSSGDQRAAAEAVEELLK